MRPHVICHMATSVDGRIMPHRWRPRGAALGGAYERIHDALEGDAWLVGRVTGQEFAKAGAYPEHGAQAFPREPWFARRGADAYAIVLDAKGKIVWGRGDVGGDPIVVVLSEAVSDAHLAGLRGDGVSYIFAGAAELDLAGALETLSRELGIERLLLEGGGVVNGAFLRVGLVDEVSLIVAPVVDGAAGAPSLFDSGEDAAAGPPPVQAMRLTHSEALDGGCVWLRYSLAYDPA
jgi:riboflavin biosynthesis pyrimidine reductase